MAGKVGVRNIQPPHRHHDAHVRREPGMGCQRFRFRFPATLFESPLPLLGLPEPCLVFALDKFLAGKMFFFADHRITRTGLLGSGPKNRSGYRGS